jgi:hypothetical protein
MALTTTGPGRSRQPVLEYNPVLAPFEAHLHVFDLRRGLVTNDDYLAPALTVEGYRRQQQRDSLSRGGSR